MLVMYPVGYIIMLNDSLKISYLSTSSFYLFVQSLMTFIILAEFTSRSKAITASFVIIFFSLLIEGIGVHTGFPFGNYSYTNTLSPILPGGVPLAIGFAWMTLSINSFLIVKYFLCKKNTCIVVILSGIFIAFIDVLLEPFASFINNYWFWEGGTIPIQNYISWFIIGILFSYAVNRIIGRNIQSVKISIPIIILVLSIFQFIIFNILNGYYIYSVIGISGILIIYLSIIILRKNEK